MTHPNFVLVDDGCVLRGLLLLDLLLLLHVLLRHLLLLLQVHLLTFVFQFFFRNLQKNKNISAVKVDLLVDVSLLFDDILFHIFRASLHSVLCVVTLLG